MATLESFICPDCNYEFEDEDIQAIIGENSIDLTITCPDCEGTAEASIPVGAFEWSSSDNDEEDEE